MISWGQGHTKSKRVKLSLFTRAASASTLADCCTPHHYSIRIHMKLGINLSERNIFFSQKIKLASTNIHGFTSRINQTVVLCTRITQNLKLKVFYQIAHMTPKFLPAAEISTSYYGYYNPNYTKHKLTEPKLQLERGEVERKESGTCCAAGRETST